jgi:hypothetical protein
MKLWIANIAPGTSDEEIRAFVKKYAADLACGDIQRVEGDGSRPAALVDCPGASHGQVEKVSSRLNGMQWKGRALLASVQST